MAKGKIEWGAGNYYHIYNRGAHRQSIVREATNYEFILKLMKKYMAELSVTVIAYCLMPNHYHWLVRQDGNLRAGLLAQRVFNSYSKAFNNRYDHSGTLFEGPYKPILVKDDSYLRHLCIYIHAQPVKDNITPFLDMWDYSNYHEWMGIRNGTLVDHDFIDNYFPNRGQYRRHLMEYLKHAICLLNWTHIFVGWKIISVRDNLCAARATISLRWITLFVSASHVSLNPTNLVTCNPSMCDALTNKLIG